MGARILGGRETVRVAAVQAAPVYLDREATVEKACRLIEEAGRHGAELVVFSEAFVSGYPAYYTAGLASPTGEWTEFSLALQQSALVIPSAETAALGEAARRAGAHVVIGCNELDERPGCRTLYNTLLFLGPDGRVLGRHRKLVPTFAERLYWGQGDGSDLEVYDTSIGRLGGLVCWEHHMILVRAALVEWGEELHVAVWPGSWKVGAERLSTPERAPGAPGCDLQPAIREHAFEAGTFVVSVSGLLRPEDLPPRWKRLAESAHFDASWAVGGSAVVGPLGTYLVEPVFDSETILYAECSAHAIAAAKALFDARGHYARPDVVGLEWRARGTPARRD